MHIDKQTGAVIFGENDIFHRELIMLSQKLLDNSVNDYFRTYYKEHCTAGSKLLTEEQDQEFISYLEEHFNFTGDDLFLTAVEIRSCNIASETNCKYKLRSAMGEQVLFDKHNGYWYESSDGDKYALFDYGNFYCMEQVLPLAYYFYLKYKKWQREHDQTKKEG